MLQTSVQMFTTQDFRKHGWG